MEVLAVLGIPVVVVLIVIIAMYNGLIRLSNHCDEAWSNIDTELKRRYNLIPNLVNTIKGYAQHEKELMEEVTRLRGECMSDQGTPAHQAGTENALLQVLNPLLARVENYPDLKADSNYMQLQEELVNTEDRIQAARRFYNGNVREHNNKVQMFPSSLVAGGFGFSAKEFFEIDELQARAAPKVGI
jgi:LemA protein